MSNYNSRTIAIRDDRIKELETELVRLHAIERRYLAMVKYGWRVTHNRFQAWVHDSQEDTPYATGATPDEALNVAIRKLEK